ncbi:TetR/AcrR family transcriptional regulator [Isoptericola chiayiensis]|uniref:TetR/AcrR family transcriptional regulator n=1 Tax=Isoptericola chiayiensis TaxID=579446 RepID=A0ABP8Y8I8_9MICO|nr:TetR/AcrR family transcriptional regulator [Isoptericola chiayiensis]NOW00742.1 AcrR family transcriptional regulator [Isoptericola chiayiensis]
MGYHHGNLRDALLDRAEQVLATDGVDGLSLRALARDLGVSHGAPARHFRDKQALLDALALAGFRRLEEALAACPGNWSDRLRGIARTYLDFAAANPALLAVMYDVKHHPEASDALRAEAERGLGQVVDAVRDGQRAGGVVDGDPGELATALFAAVHGVVQLALGNLLEPDETDRALVTVLTISLRGLSPSPGPARPAG